MRFSNVASPPAGEAYNCGMLPAGISNSVNSSYSSAVLQCLFNHPSFPSLFNQLFSSHPQLVVLTAGNSRVSEHLFELIVTSIVSVLLFQVNSAVLLHSERYKYFLMDIKLSPAPLLAACPA